MTEHNLWVDDLRPVPDESWRWAKTSEEAIKALHERDWRQISLDHDLGEEDTTRAVVLFMVHNQCFPPVVRVHTANPVGRQWLVGMVEQYGPGVTR